MKNAEEFLKEAVNFEYCENCRRYELEPAPLYFYNGTDNLTQIPTHAGVLPVYAVFTHFARTTQRAYMVLSFPPLQDIETTFIGIFISENGHISIKIYPFDDKTGIILNPIENSRMEEFLLKDVKTVLKASKSKSIVMPVPLNIN